MSSFDGWIPIAVSVDAATPMVEWCHLGNCRFDAPFFRDTVDAALRLPFNSAFRRRTPIEVVEALAEELPGIAPTAFVLHASRCGSTLLARMLMSLGSHVVLSEPDPLDFVLHGHPLLPAFPDEIRRGWLRALVAVMSQVRGGRETQLIIKLDPFNILNFPLLRSAFPETPWIFLYRDPVEIAVSQWKIPGARMVPGNLGPAAALVPIDAALRMPVDEYIARIVGGLFEAGARYCAEAGGLPVNYVELPAAVGASLASILGIEANAATAAALGAAALSSAKAPGSRFVPDSARKQSEASPALRRAIEVYAMPHYRTLEVMRTQRQSAADGGWSQSLDAP